MLVVFAVQDATMVHEEHLQGRVSELMRRFPPLRWPFVKGTARFFFSKEEQEIQLDSWELR